MKKIISILILMFMFATHAYAGISCSRCYFGVGDAGGSGGTDTIGNTTLGSADYEIGEATRYIKITALQTGTCVPTIYSGYGGTNDYHYLAMYNSSGTRLAISDAILGAGDGWNTKTLSSISTTKGQTLWVATSTSGDCSVKEDSGNTYTTYKTTGVQCPATLSAGSEDTAINEIALYVELDYDA